MNKSDSERIAGILDNLGHKKTLSENKADLIILNTCVVRQSAEDRIYGKLKNLQLLKKKNPKLQIAVTGCMAKIYPKKLFGKTDLIFSIEDLPKLPLLLKNTYLKKNKEDYLHIPPAYDSKFHAYIPVMTGCNNFCSYCVVPYARGKERSRPVEEIIKEITELINKDYKAITLIGQNVNSYGQDLDKKINFAQLLRKINDLPGNFWLWFVTSHPKDMSDELIDTLAEAEKIGHYLHLPVQAGNNQVLRAMNRGYTREYYINLIKKIRKKIPDLVLSTDIIVGFPGETKKQFQETVNLFKKIKFDMAYIARYSPRPKTAAYKLKDNLSPSEKKRRERILTEILKKTALENNKKLIGKRVEILVEKSNSKWGIGKTKTFKTVKFKNSKNLLGKIIKVKITQAMPWGLKGERQKE